MNRHGDRRDLEELRIVEQPGDTPVEVLEAVYQAWCRDLEQAEPAWRAELKVPPEVEVAGLVGAMGVDTPSSGRRNDGSGRPWRRWRRTLVRLATTAAAVAVGMIWAGWSMTAKRPDRGASEPLVVHRRGATLPAMPSGAVHPARRAAHGIRPGKLDAGQQRETEWQDVIDQRLDAARYQIDRLMHPVSAEDRYFEQVQQAVRQLAVEAERSPL